MIQEFRIKNFLSFKDEVTFSFEATKDKNLEDYYVTEVAPGVRLLKLGIVYGANASGKSNLINAFEFLKNFWISGYNSKEENNQVTPYLFDQETPKQPSEFKLTFYAKGIKFVYSLKLNEEVILYERLDFYPGVQPAVIFERKLNNAVSEIIFGTKTKVTSVAKNEIAIRCLTNTSLIAAYKQVNFSIPELNIATEWMQKQFIPVIHMKSIDLKTTEIRVAENEILKKQLQEKLNRSGLNISAIDSEIIREELNNDFLEKVKLLGISSSEYDKLKQQKNLVRVQTVFHHSIEGNPETIYKLSLEHESDGTKQLFALHTALIEQQQNKAFLIIDDFDLLLHPLLMEEILTNYLKEKSTNSQLLITTNNVSLLSEKDLIRKDAIWFTNKKKDGSTELYSLADFNIRKELSYYNAYKLGKFGAVPKVF
ncbi:MAG TPA: ATP-binding protein [Prolixibacteraceae bacterium]|nr:ATP-binding protein [Prolixibacteraceae bacterium]